MGASLRGRLEVEAHRQDIGVPTVWQRAECSRIARCFDGALGAEVEGKAPRPGDEMDFTHRTIPENEEADFREAVLPARLAVPILVDLGHDVPEIFRKGELEAGRLDRRHI